MAQCPRRRGHGAHCELPDAYIGRGPPIKRDASSEAVRSSPHPTSGRNTMCPNVRCGQRREPHRLAGGLPRDRCGLFLTASYIGPKHGEPNVGWGERSEPHHLAGGCLATDAVCSSPHPTSGRNTMSPNVGCGERSEPHHLAGGLARERCGSFLTASYIGRRCGEPNVDGVNEVNRITLREAWLATDAVRSSPHPTYHLQLLTAPCRSN